VKRRVWVILGGALGAVILCVVLIWPAAPLWERLGAQPICLQGAWPDLKIVDCPSPTPIARATLLPLPVAPAQGPIPLIFDDDGSPDGMIALLYFLRNPLFDVRAVTVSSGEAHPDVFAPKLQRLLAGLGHAEITVGAGRATPLEGDNAFPEPWRQASDDFWSLSYPEATPSHELASASELMIDILKTSTRPVTVFVSGTHTNLAEALRLDPTIASNIQEVRVMGGSVYVPGNIHSDWPEFDNTTAEWNLWVDPVAAAEIFASGLPIDLTPLDATNRIIWTESDARTWSNSDTPEGATAGRLLQWMLDSWSPTGVYVWDLVAAIGATDPDLCPEVPLALDVLVDPGQEQGRTAISEGAPNAGVCLEPDADRMRALARAVFGG
jgi:inosine-uridine nucleoside N-ribohydrolase